MKKNKNGVRLRSPTFNGKLFIGFPKKENGPPNRSPIFFSANPACSLRFPIAATQAKLILS